MYIIGEKEGPSANKVVFYMGGVSLKQPPSIISVGGVTHYFVTPKKRSALKRCKTKTRGGGNKKILVGVFLP